MGRFSSKKTKEFQDIINYYNENKEKIDSMQKDWKHPENRQELFNRYFKFRVLTHDLDHTHYMKYLTKDYDYEDKAWFAFAFGMTYRTPQAFAYTETFRNLHKWDLETIENWHRDNWKRTTYGTDARYNKGHFYSQVKSLKEWLDGKTFKEKLESICSSESARENFDRLYKEVQSLYKFGRMTGWLTLQALHDLLELNIDPEEILLEGYSPNNDSSLQSIWNGLCALTNKSEKMVGKYGTYKCTEEDVIWGREKLKEYTAIAEEYSGFKIDSFRKESIWCFTGDTKISLLDGREVEIQYLVNEEEFWVYSCEENGEIVPGRGHSARVTKYVDELLEIELDNGEIVRCTPEHLWMVRDGSYKRADELEVGSSLMPLYKKESTSQGYLNGYEIFKNNRTEKWEYTHHMVASKTKLELKESLEQSSDDYAVVHHIGKEENGVMVFDNKNNSPENLTYMLSKSHLAYHAKEWASHPDKTKKLSEIRLNMSEEISNWMKKSWKDQEYREFHTKKCENQWKDPHSTIRKAVSEKWEDEEYKAKMENVFKELWEDEEHQKHMSECSTDNWKKDEYRNKIRKSRAVNPYSKLKLTTKDYSEYLKQLQNGRDSGEVYSCCSIMSEPEFDFYIINENIETDKYYNHKVVSIKRVFLKEKIPVYDITVDNIHNFALTSGVFVHNCQYKRLFNEDCSKEYTGHASGDAASRYLYYKEHWPEINWEPFREAIRTQPGIMKGLTFIDWFNQIFSETGIMVNMHQMFDDMTDFYSVFNYDVEKHRIKDYWLDDGLNVPTKFNLKEDLKTSDKWLKVIDEKIMLGEK